MPPKARTEKARKLNADEAFELFFGFSTSVTRSAFPSAEAKRAAWFRHRDELLAHCHPFRRPSAFWLYEADFAGFEQPVDSDEAERLLYDNGMLSGAEVLAWEAKRKATLT